MKRTIATGLSIWKRRGFLWPFRLLKRAVICRLRGIPRGLIAEPSQACHGCCAGCPTAVNPAMLEPGLLHRWLSASPAEPVTIHFNGKHSDPLASPLLKDLALTARKHSSMLSISTIGLGLAPGQASLPFDRWIFSLPASNEASWNEVRGNSRFGEALANIETVRQTAAAMVEVVLTLWRPSWRDGDEFRRLAAHRGWAHIHTAFGRYDPSGQHVGRVENLALEAPDCPYFLDAGGSVRLKRRSVGCPLAGCLFLDAMGILRPCPFTGDESPHIGEPSAESWRTARKWTEQKNGRGYPACEWCP
jgi:hypothetical protein